MGANYRLKDRTEEHLAMMSTKEQHNYQIKRSQEHPKTEGKTRKKRRTYTIIGEDWGATEESSPETTQVRRFPDNISQTIESLAQGSHLRKWLPVWITCMRVRSHRKRGSPILSTFGLAKRGRRVPLLPLLLAVWSSPSASFSNMRKDLLCRKLTTPTSKVKEEQLSESKSDEQQRPCLESEASNNNAIYTCSE